MENISMEIVRFCAIECKLQMSGEMSVLHMIEAWQYAQANSGNVPTVDDVLALGALVEPYDNALGFRKVDVRVGWDVKLPWEDVPSATVSLMETLGQGCLGPDSFFKQYEDVHPFRDGNGRTGVILYNWISGTLDHPVWAPNFWNDPRRTVGHGA